jgi:hypothetical protein
MALHHVIESDLERYYLGSFEGMELDMIDEHLLWCIDCCERLERIEENDHVARVGQVGRSSDARVVYLGFES